MPCICLSLYHRDLMINKDPSTLPLSLSSHRHSYISMLFRCPCAKWPCAKKQWLRPTVFVCLSPSCLCQTTGDTHRGWRTDSSSSSTRNKMNKKCLLLNNNGRAKVTLYVGLPASRRMFLFFLTLLSWICTPIAPSEIMPTATHDSRRSDQQGQCSCCHSECCNHTLTLNETRDLTKVTMVRLTDTISSHV
jgi:hypothetical protein